MEEFLTGYTGFTRIVSKHVERILPDIGNLNPPRPMATPPVEGIFAFFAIFRG
jgi:hypothetical protein